MTPQPQMIIRPIEDADEDATIALWEKTGLTRAYNNPQRDMDLARRGPSSEILVGLLGNTLTASVMVGHDGHRGTVYYLSVDPDAQGSGHGRAMMDGAADWLKERGVWKFNFMVRASNEHVHGFYEALGFKTQPRTVFTKWLEEPPVPPVPPVSD